MIKFEPEFKPPAAKEVQLLTRAAAAIMLKVEFSNKVLPIQSSAFRDCEGQPGKAMIQTPNPQKRTKKKKKPHKKIQNMTCEAKGLLWCCVDLPWAI